MSICVPFRISYDSVVSKAFFDREKDFGPMNMINLIQVILINSELLTGFVKSGPIYDDLAKFCSNNGMVFLSLSTTSEKTSMNYESNLAFMAFKQNGLRIRKLSYDKLQVWFSQIKIEITPTPDIPKLEIYHFVCLFE